MQSRSRMSSRKRFFRDLENEGTSTASETFPHEDMNAETILDQYIYQEEHGDALDQFHTGMTDHQPNPNHKILKKTMFFEHLEDEGTSVNSRIIDDNENITGKNVVDNSFSFGQAIYQKAKQGVIIQYKDHGDNTFQCIHCNAYYWRDEKNTRGIYTGCCQQGQKIIPLAPAFPWGSNSFATPTTLSGNFEQDYSTGTLLIRPLLLGALLHLPLRPPRGCNFEEEYSTFLRIAMPALP